MQRIEIEAVLQNAETLVDSIDLDAMRTALLKLVKVV